MHCYVSILTVLYSTLVNTIVLVKKVIFFYKRGLIFQLDFNPLL